MPSAKPFSLPPITRVTRSAFATNHSGHSSLMPYHISDQWKAVDNDRDKWILNRRSEITAECCVTHRTTYSFQQSPVGNNPKQCPMIRSRYLTHIHLQSKGMHPLHQIGRTVEEEAMPKGQCHRQIFLRHFQQLCSPHLHQQHIHSMRIAIDHDMALPMPMPQWHRFTIACDRSNAIIQTVACCQGPHIASALQPHSLFHVAAENIDQ